MFGPAKIILAGNKLASGNMESCLVSPDPPCRFGRSGWRCYRNTEICTDMVNQSLEWSLGGCFKDFSQGDGGAGVGVVLILLYIYRQSRLVLCACAASMDGHKVPQSLNCVVYNCSLQSMPKQSPQTLAILLSFSLSMYTKLFTIQIPKWWLLLTPFLRWLVILCKHQNSHSQQLQSCVHPVERSGGGREFVTTKWLVDASCKTSLLY